MENKKLLETFKLTSPIKTILNNYTLKYNLIKTNTIDLSCKKPYGNKYKNANLVLKFKLLEKVFNVIRKRINQNRYIFDKFKLFLNHKTKNKTTRSNLLPFDLKKEIFLDKLSTNRLKEEYYNKCNIINNKGMDNNLKNKLSNNDINYIPKTHNILLEKNCTTNRKNFLTNEINHKTKFSSHINKNFLMKNTAPNFYNNNIRIKIKKTKAKYKNNYSDNNNFLSSTKGKYSKKRISLNLNNCQNLNLNLNKNRIHNEEKKLISTCSPYRDSPSYLGTEENKIDNEDDSNNIIKKYYKNINNIFLSDFPDNLNDYQADTYNPKNNFNLYSNYLNYNNYNINDNNNKNITTEKKIYKKHNSLNLKKENKENKENINTANGLNKGKLFKEIIINYNRSNKLTFDGLKKNLKNEFEVHPKNSNTNSSNKLYIINENYENKNDEKSKNKTGNNKYITYNNIININDPYIMQKSSSNKNNYNIKDITLLKKCENKSPKIQSYLISFNKSDSPKSSFKNINKEELVYHRPKSSSKFKRIHRSANYSTDFKNYFYVNKNFVEFNGS